MTLILACLTARNVYQVSDRRLTSLSNPETIIDDERNKAVFIGRISFGYTGLSEIGRERTDDWLARVISKGPTNDMAQVAERIRNEATAAFQQLPKTLPQKFRHQAFQGVGWFRLKGQHGLSPGIVTVHNCIDEKTDSWLVNPLEQFRTATLFPSSLPGGCMFNSVGVVPTAGEREAIVRRVRKCVKHRNSTPATVLKAMIKCMRWLSGRHSRIGKSLLAVSVPLHSVEEMERTRRFTLFAAPPNDSTATFTYVSPRGSQTWYGPHLVGEGTVLTGVQVGSVENLPPDLLKKLRAIDPKNS
jgi:hypothetical protein